MNSRKTMIVAALTGLLGSSAAMGLGLGEIKQHSALNEPLVAEVELTGVGDLSELEVLANLGSPEDFALAGVEREFFLTDLKFSVDLSNKRRPLIRITSNKPVKEPYLDFLLEVQWPSGRLLREYTLLLDLPVFAEGKTAAKPVEVAGSARQPQSRASRSATSAGQSVTLAAGESYRVRSGDTLWGIAQAAAPNDSSVYQTMVAIHRANPDAFINGDANLLKRNAILRVPGRDAIARISHDDAVRQITPSASQFSAKETLAVTEVILDASAEEGESDSATSTAAEGRLKLTSATAGDAMSRDTEATPSGDPSLDSTTSGHSSTASRNLQDELALVQEELDKTSRENAELLERMRQMEEQMATMQRILALNDPTLAALQQQSVAQAAEQNAQPDAAVSADELIGTEIEVDTPEALDSPQGEAGEMEAGEIAVAEELLAEDSDAEATATVPTDESLEQDMSDAEAQSATDLGADSELQSAAEPQPASQPQQETKPRPVANPAVVDNTETKSGMFDWRHWLDLLLYPVLGILAILVLVLILFRNRDDEDDEQLAADERLDLPVEAEEEEDHDALTAEDIAIAESMGETLTEEELSGLELGEGEEVDPLGEADIYLSLDNYSQAETLLQSAIEKEPENAALRLKLLEVYLASGASVKFIAQKEELDALGNPEASSKARLLAEEMGLGDLEEVVDLPETEDLPDLDIPSIDTARTVTPSPVAEPESEPVVESEQEDDFDLDLDLESLELESADLENADLESNDLEILDLENTDLEGIASEGIALEGIALEGIEADLETDIDAAADELDLDEISLDSDISLDLEEGIDAEELDLGELSLDGESSLEQEAMLASEGLLDDSAEHDAIESELDLELDLSDVAISGESDELDLSEELNLSGETPLETPAVDLPEPSVELVSPEVDDSADDFMADIEADLDMLSDSDECSTKLDLAEAFVEMGDRDGAREILEEVLAEGNDEQKARAQSMIDTIS